MPVIKPVHNYPTNGFTASFEVEIPNPLPEGVTLVLEKNLSLRALIDGEPAQHLLNLLGIDEYPKVMACDGWVYKGSEGGTCKCWRENPVAPTFTFLNSNTVHTVEYYQLNEAALGKNQT